MSKKVIFIFSAFYLSISFFVTYVLVQNGLIYFVNGDSHGWIEFAQTIHNQGIGSTIRWPPLYALFIAPFVNVSNLFILISLLQAVLYLFTLFLLDNMMQIPVRFRFVIFLILLFMPAFFLIGRVPLAETTCLFFYIFHAFFLTRYIVNKRFMWLMMSVVFLVLATFTKPTTILLHVVEYPIVFAWFYFKKVSIKNGWKLLLFSLFIPSLIYGGWIGRNYKKTGVFVFASVANYNLLMHNYFHLLPYFKNSNLKPGEELQLIKSEQVRSNLINIELPAYIRQKLHQEPNRLSQVQLYADAGKMAVAQILQHIPLYFLIHYLKSLALFMPDNWETLRHIFPQAKTFIMIVDVSIGGILFILFIKSIKVFIKSLCGSRGYNSKILIATVLCINIFYLLSIVGPTALDDGGRFSFVFYPWLLLFFGITLS